MASQRSFALFCGICLLIFGWAKCRDFITENLTTDINKLKVHLNITTDLTLFGNPLFLKNLNTPEIPLEESAQKLLVHEILDVYIHILSHLMNHTEDRDVKLSIERIIGRVENLQDSASYQRMNAMKKKLQELWTMKTNDTIVQRKAVRELIPVFQRASKLVGRIQEKVEKRRRRQIRRKQSGFGTQL